MISTMVHLVSGRFLPAAVAAFLLLAPAPTCAEADSKSPAVAEVAGRTITSEMVTSYSALVRETEGQDADPEGVIDDLVMQIAIDEVFTTIPTTETKAETPSPYSTMGERMYLKTRLREAIDAEVEVSRDEMAEWFEKNRDNYIGKERVHARHLFMQTSSEEESSSTEKVRARLEGVVKKFNDGVPFADLATTYSEAASGAFGGNIGWVAWRQPVGPEAKPMNPALEEALFALKAGEMSPIVETRHGLHLLYAEEHVTTSVPTLDDLVSSGILPGALKGKKVQDAVQKTIEKSVEKHRAKVVATSATADLTTNTPAVEFDGEIMTVADLEKIYGERFTRAFNRARSNPQALEQLMKQVLDDEAMVRAAVARGLDKSKQAKLNLELVRQRAHFNARMRDIQANAYQVTDEQAKARYEVEKHQFLQPEAEGHIITIAFDRSSTDPAVLAKATGEAMEKAEKLRSELTSATVEVIEAKAREVSTDDRASSGGRVDRHIIGRLQDESGRNFDACIGGLAEPGSWSNVRAVANSYVIARLGQRWEGEPAPYEEVAGRIKNRLQFENQLQLRKDVQAMLESKGLLKWLPGAAQFGKQVATDDSGTTTPAGGPK